MSAAPQPAPQPTPMAALDAAQLAMLRGLRNGQLLPQLLRTWRAQALQQLANLRGALGNQSCSELNTIAHSFKSASYSIGAKQVGELCARLEAAARAGQLPDCQQLIVLLSTHVAEAIDEIDTQLT